MTEYRWAFLWAALACGLFLFVIPMSPARALISSVPDIALFLIATAAMGLQALGAIGMRTRLRAANLRARFVIAASFIAAIGWGVALLAAIWGESMGPGGIVVGILVMLPAAILALALQIAALIFFARAERKLGQRA